MTTRFRIDADHSRFTVRAFADGLLSFLGHGLTFAVRTFAGTVAFEDDLIANLKLDLTVAAGGDTRPGDRGETEGRVRADVLEAVNFPEVRFRAAAAASEKIAQGRYRILLAGTLSVRGTDRPHRLEAELAMFPDGLRLRGETRLRTSEFGIRPVTALGGTVRLKDEVELAFDLAGSQEAS